MFGCRKNYRNQVLEVCARVFVRLATLSVPEQLWERRARDSSGAHVSEADVLHPPESACRNTKRSAFIRILLVSMPYRLLLVNVLCN